MAPSAISDLPPVSALQQNLDSNQSIDSPHPPYLQHLAAQILHDLQYQHDWSALTIHTHSLLTSQPLLRPIISGRPPRRAYIHPDEQIETLKAEHATGKKLESPPEMEWVLPTHLQERMSLSKFAAVFDALPVVPPAEEVEQAGGSAEAENVGAKWQGHNRQKRLLLATLHDDSTVTYYIMHDGIVKPRQN